MSIHPPITISFFLKLKSVQLNQKPPNFLFFLIVKECEEELNRLEKLFDNTTSTTEVTHSLIDELRTVRVTFFSILLLF
jgi:hypothetical protein